MKDSSKLTRVFYKTLAKGSPVVDVRTRDQLLPISHYRRSHNKQTNENAGTAIVALLVIATPYILYFAGKKQLESLQQSRSKAKVPFFWAVASLAHVFNVYMVAKLLTAACNDNNKIKHAKNREEACFWIITVFVYIHIVSGISAYIHCKYITFPIPKTWSIFTKCCGGYQHRIITTISLGEFTCV